jgi:hypothetical protein
LECTKIWYFLSPLLAAPFLGVLTIDQTLKCQKRPYFEWGDINLFFLLFFFLPAAITLKMGIPLDDDHPSSYTNLTLARHQLFCRHEDLFKKLPSELYIRTEAGLEDGFYKRESVWLDCINCSANQGSMLWS